MPGAVEVFEGGETPPMGDRADGKGTKSGVLSYMCGEYPGPGYNFGRGSIPGVRPGDESPSERPR